MFRAGLRQSARPGSACAVDGPPFAPVRLGSRQRSASASREQKQGWKDHEQAARERRKFDPVAAALESFSIHFSLLARLESAALIAPILDAESIRRSFCARARTDP